MIEISTQMFSFFTNQFTFDIALAFLQDDFIPEDNYIEFITDDGLNAAIRKKDIIAISEVHETNV